MLFIDKSRLALSTLMVGNKCGGTHENNLSTSISDQGSSSLVVWNGIYIYLIHGMHYWHLVQK